MGGQDLSEEQIRQLLLNAEARLATLSPNNNDARNPSVRRSSQHRLLSIPKLNCGAIVQPYILTKGDVAQADTHRLLKDDVRQVAGRIRQVEDPVLLEQKATKTKRATAGPDWFNLPRTNITPELKRDLQLLKMRNVLDPKRHYKKENAKAKPPEFSHVGTVVEGPTEFFSARIQNKDRMKTLVEEVLASESSTGRFKSKYNKVQSAKTSGKKAHYKELKAKRSHGIRK